MLGMLSAAGADASAVAAELLAAGGGATGEGDEFEGAMFAIVFGDVALAAVGQASFLTPPVVLLLNLLAGVFELSVAAAPVAVPADAPAPRLGFDERGQSFAA